MIKIKKFLKKSFVLVPTILLTSTTAFACSASDTQFYLANFQNYMSNELLNELKEEHKNFNFRSFATNEDLERNFSTNYDVAISSAYLIAKLANNGQLEVIDWSKFNLYKLDDKGNRTNEPIKNAADALTLFDDKTRNILTNIYYLKDFPKPSEGGLLNYCVPYFLQNFIFAYKNPTTIFTSNFNWDDILNYANTQLKENKINRIAMIDDYRSIYSIPRLIETKDAIPTVNPGEPSNTTSSEPIKPTNDKNYSINDFVNTYHYLSNKFNHRNSFLLNSDSNIILNNFADPKGSDAGIMYNGDVLYAFQGGDNYSSETKFPEWIRQHFTNNTFNLQIADPGNTLIALDAMMINKNSKHKDEAYDIIKKIGLEGADLSLYSENDTKYNSDSIFTKNENDEYIYGPMINFDSVQYTTPLKNLNTYVLNSYNKFDSIGGYFKEQYEFLLDHNILNETQFKAYIKVLVETFEIKKDGNSNNTLEQNLSDINKSNMYYAYQEIRTGI